MYRCYLKSWAWIEILKEVERKEAIQGLGPERSTSRGQEEGKSSLEAEKEWEPHLEFSTQLIILCVNIADRASGMKSEKWPSHSATWRSWAALGSAVLLSWWQWDPDGSGCLIRWLEIRHRPQRTVSRFVSFWGVTKRERTCISLCVPPIVFNFERKEVIKKIWKMGEDEIIP